MATSMPAPSPDCGSQPHPPRCDMRTNISLQSVKITRDGFLFRSATKPTPQLSRSCMGSYNAVRPGAFVSAARWRRGARRAPAAPGAGARAGRGVTCRPRRPSGRRTHVAVAWLDDSLAWPRGRTPAYGCCACACATHKHLAAVSGPVLRQSRLLREQWKT